LSPDQASALARGLDELADAFDYDLAEVGGLASLAGTIIAIVAKFGLSEAAAALLAGVAASAVALFAGAGAIVGGLLLHAAAQNLRYLSKRIDEYNDPVYGLAIGSDGDSLTLLNRRTRATKKWDIPWWLEGCGGLCDGLPSDLAFGQIRGKIDVPGVIGESYFIADCPRCANSR